jgi:uncharacterized protein YwgA
MSNMSAMQTQTIVAELVNRLREYDSWCGETHIQKATYFLMELMNIRLSYEFVMYKHGPYSFDLHADLISMKANDLLKTESRDPYGPSFNTGHLWGVMSNLFPKTLNKYERHIQYVAETLSNKSVVSLEELATALFVSRVDNIPGTVEYRARVICELKPHISSDSAKKAVEEVDDIIKDAGQNRLILVT